MCLGRQRDPASKKSCEKATVPSFVKISWTLRGPTSRFAPRSHVSVCALRWPGVSGECFRVVEANANLGNQLLTEVCDNPR